MWYHGPFPCYLLTLDGTFPCVDLPCDRERRAQPVSMTVRLELRVGAASPGAALDAHSFCCGTVECSLGQAGRDAPIASAAALVAWFREAAAMANATPARERASRMAVMAAELQAQLAP